MPELSSSSINDETWELWLQQTSQQMPYPPTPDVTQAVLSGVQSKQRSNHIGYMGRIAAILIVASAIMLVVPDIRASILEAIRLGAVTIFQIEQTEEAPPTPVTLPFENETTLQAAQEQTTFAILMPTYPTRIGNPDHVLLFPDSAQTIVLVWLEDETSPALNLFMLDADGVNSGIFKSMSVEAEIEIVNGEIALWLDTPHAYELFQGSQTIVEGFVKDHVLIWFEGGVTYRLETNLPLEDAVKIAESLQ